MIGDYKSDNSISPDSTNTWIKLTITTETVIPSGGSVYIDASDFMTASNACHAMVTDNSDVL